MAIRRIRIDYTVYRSDDHPGDPCWDFRTFIKAKSAARSFGVGARVYRNFNQTNKRNKVLGDWWVTSISGLGVVNVLSGCSIRSDSRGRMM
jgi:hypothetical protein